MAKERIAMRVFLRIKKQELQARHQILQQLRTHLHQTPGAVLVEITCQGYQLTEAHIVT